MTKNRRKQRQLDASSLEINTSHSTTISTRDKLVFTAFVALMVHIVIVLGISFSAYGRFHARPTIEVTLAQHIDKKTPDKADYLAQYNQEASGTLDRKAELTTDRRADFADTAIREVTPDKPKQKAITQPQKNEQVITTRRETSNKITQDKKGKKMR